MGGTNELRRCGRCGRCGRESDSYERCSCREPDEACIPARDGGYYGKTRSSNAASGSGDRERDACGIKHPHIECKPRCDEGCSSAYPDYASLLHGRGAASVEGQMVPRKITDTAGWPEGYWIGSSKGDRRQREASRTGAAVASSASTSSSLATWLAATFYLTGVATGIGLTLWYWKSWITAHPLFPM
jgi:hypothetical protein